MDGCPVCGANLALVGRSHHCRPRKIEPVTVPVSQPEAVTNPEPVANTYRYRDPEARRAYMRDYMRRRRNGIAS